MKNKLLISLAILIAANAFVSTPASAYTWTDAYRDGAKAAKVTGKAALATAKTAFGVAALGTAVALPFVAYCISNNPNPEFRLTSIKVGAAIGTKLAYDSGHKTVFTGHTGQDIELLPAIYAMVGATSLLSSLVGYKALSSAWNDIKNINS